jgi:hypothetical protein
LVVQPVASRYTIYAIPALEINKVSFLKFSEDITVSLKFFHKILPYLLLESGIGVVDIEAVFKAQTYSTVLIPK